VGRDYDNYSENEGPKSPSVVRTEPSHIVWYNTVSSAVIRGMNIGEVGPKI
jgi:hypothetical protein